MTDHGLSVSDDRVISEAWEQLRDVYDPELALNLVDLGLIYRLNVDDGAIQVEMTLTTPGCPLGDSMRDAVERALLMIPGVSGVSVDLVWEPRWEPEMMSESARRELGWK